MGAGQAREVVAAVGDAGALQDRRARRQKRAAGRAEQTMLANGNAGNGRDGGTGDQD
jgi:hypothetical protein